MIERTSISCSSTRLNAQHCAISLFILLGLFSHIGCTGPRLRSDLHEDRNIMVRKWTFPTRFSFDLGEHGTEYSNPILFENTVIFGSRTQGVTALYPTLLQKRWNLSMTGGVVSELAIDQSRVFLGGGDGFFYSIQADTGRVNWKYPLKTEIVSRPTVVGGRVFVTASNHVVHALDANTGKWLWHYKRKLLPGTTLYGASSPLVLGQQVLVGMSDGFLVSLSLESGQPLWEKQLYAPTQFKDIHAQPISDEGILYVPTYDGALHALRLKEGGADLLWKFDAGGSKKLRIDGERLFLPSSDGSVYALQKKTGALLWQFELDRGVPTELVVTEQHVIFGSSSQYLYAINKNTVNSSKKATGVYRFDVGSGSGFSSAPLFDPTSRQLYALSGAGNLYCFKLQNPKNDNSILPTKKVGPRELSKIP